VSTARHALHALASRERQRRVGAGLALLPGRQEVAWLSIGPNGTRLPVPIAAYALLAPAHVCGWITVRTSSTVRCGVESWQGRPASLSAAPGQILRAGLGGGLPGGADIENALFCNLDGRGAFNRAMGQRRPFRVGPGRCGEYELVPASAAFRYGT
jgi:hypothetical protein